MNRVARKDADEAYAQLPDLLAAAEKGCSTIITRHGRPVAALIPVEQYDAINSQQPLLALKGSGRGMWKRDRSRSIRDEWYR